MLERDHNKLIGYHVQETTWIKPEVIIMEIQVIVYAWSVLDSSCQCPNPWAI